MSERERMTERKRERKRERKKEREEQGCAGALVISNSRCFMRHFSWIKTRKGEYSGDRAAGGPGPGGAVAGPDMVTRASCWRGLGRSARSRGGAGH